MVGGMAGEMDGHRWVLLWALGFWEFGRFGVVFANDLSFRSFLSLFHTLINFPTLLKYCFRDVCKILRIVALAYHSSCPPRPPLSRERPVAPTFVLLFDLRPPSSLYISRMSPLLGRDAASVSLRHCSSFTSLGD